MVEWRWGLAPLTLRDANARNLAEMLNFNLARRDQPTSSSAPADKRGVMIAEQVVRIDVHKDRLMVRFKPAGRC